MSRRHDPDHLEHHPEENEEEEIDFEPAWVYDARFLGEEVPVGFNAVRVPLNGTLRADLAWGKEKNAARDYIQKGLRIFWDIDLGLFDRLKHSLDNQTQFLSLCLSLEHFRDTLWKEFYSQSVGLCLYRGPAALENLLRWNDLQEENLKSWLQHLYGDVEDLSMDLGGSVKSFENIHSQRLFENPTGRYLLSLFCRDAAGEYLDLLASRLLNTMTCFVLLDVAAAAHIPLLHSAQLVTKERYSRLIVGVKGASYGLAGEFGWEGEPMSSGILTRNPTKSEVAQKPSVGICLPCMTCCRPSDYRGLAVALDKLIAQNIPFRIIPESMLNAEWDGLDTLIVEPKVISLQGSRKLQGFIAASGEVISATLFDTKILSL